MQGVNVHGADKLTPAWAATQAGLTTQAGVEEAEARLAGEEAEAVEYHTNIQHWDTQLAD